MIQPAFRSLSKSSKILDEGPAPRKTFSCLATSLPFSSKWFEAITRAINSHRLRSGHALPSCQRHADYAWLWFGKASLLCNWVFVWNGALWLVSRENRVTKKDNISKFGAVFMCFAAVSCIADVNNMAASVLEWNWMWTMVFLVVMLKNKRKMTIISKRRRTNASKSLSRCIEHKRNLERRNYIWLRNFTPECANFRGLSWTWWGERVHIKASLYFSAKKCFSLILRDALHWKYSPAYAKSIKTFPLQTIKLPSGSDGFLSE